MSQLVAVAGGAGFQPGEQLFRNAAHAFVPQRAEHDELIQPPDELGPEPLLGLGDGLRRLLFKGGFRAAPKAQRGALARQEPCAQIGREQHDGVAEIRFAAHGIRQLAVFQNLQKHILDIRVGFLNFVKQHDAVGAAADGLGELPALVVAQIARGRTQQAGHGVLLLILRHIKLEQGFFAAEPPCRQRFGKGRFAHARGPQKEHGSHGAARLAEPSAAAPDGPGHRFHGLVLAHHLGVEAGFQFVQPFPLFLPYPLGGHAAGLRHHPGHFFPGEAGAGLALPFGPDAGGGTGFVDEVDGFVGQAAPRQVTHRELYRFPQRLLGQLDAVVPLVARGQPLQNLHSLFRRGLLNLHPAEAPFQRRILLDVGPELLIGRGPDEL